MHRHQTVETEDGHAILAGMADSFVLVVPPRLVAQSLPDDNKPRPFHRIIFAQSERTTVMRLAMIAMLCLASGVLHARQSPQTIPDLVLAHGRVIDPESGLDAVRHVGITKGKIVVVSATPLQGKETIDVRGLVVAPGLIDLHSHSQELPGARMQACDGVTTHLELEAGAMPISAHYDRLAKEGRPINYGASVSWAVARIVAIHKLKPQGRGISSKKVFYLPTGPRDWPRRSRKTRFST